MSDFARYFSANYGAARDQFRTAARHFGWECQAHPFPSRGPTGEELTLDVAISPSKNLAEKGSSKDPPLRAATIVVSSGLHGVEGFVGSAVQCALLDHLAADPGPVRYVLLHALNPYGFAHLRRFDAENIDPNRNFLLPGEAYAGSPPLYDQLDPLLNSRTVPRRLDFFLLKGLVAIARFGMPALKQAIAGGQYDYPRGLFYGGAGPCATQRLLASLLPQLLASNEQVVHFDIHSGLGAPATLKLLLDYTPTARQRAQLDRWFGRQAYETNSATDTAYEARGSFGQWLVAHQLAPDYLYLCAEFGTYAPLKVLAGLRAENQVQHWSTTQTAIAHPAKQHLQELFCPAAPSWRRAVVTKALEVIHKAADGLAHG